ncbi:MAG: ABC transporter permease, partial [Bryobacteraceae bacterium]
MSPLRESLLLIRAASFLVPRIQRSEWLREWEAEIWYCSTRLPRRQLRGLCWGSFADAAWHRFHGLTRANAVRWARDWSQSATFCLLSILGAVIFLTFASGFLPRTRAIVMPLPYANAERIATVSQSGLSFSVRSGIPMNWVRLWQQKSKLIEDFAAYTWETTTVIGASSEKSQILLARAGENFFSLLGVNSVAGREFHPGDVLLSYDFWRSRYGSKPLVAGSSLTVGGTRYRITGVLPKGFWFLSPDIAVWSVLNANGESANARTGVVARLGPDVSEKMAQAELQSILYGAGFPLLDSIVDVSPLQARVRSVLGSFALALALAMVITIAGLRLHIQAMDELNLKLDAWR